MKSKKVIQSKQRQRMGASARCRVPFKPAVRTRKRTYKLDVYLAPLDELVWDVVNSIERTEIAVPDLTDDGSLAEKHDEDGAILIDSDAKLKVPLADWLAVGCQCIRWHHAEGDEALADGTCGVTAL